MARPAYRKPQLASLADRVPEGSAWLHEIKYDGYRALVAVDGRDVAVYTRNGKDWTDKFGPLVEAIAALDLPPALMDGEIVAYDAKGNPDFSTLQKVLKRGHGSQSKRDRLGLHLFDLLELEGEDLTALGNLERKNRLAALLKQAKPPIHFSDHVVGDGETLLKKMCGAGGEGIISKKADAPYRSRRTKAWLKVKCIRRDEFVIVGFKNSDKAGRPFSSLLIAQHDAGTLTYKGNVGTGFTQDEMSDLAAKMRRLERKTAPVDTDKASARGVTWLKPSLVAEIAFAEFTAEGSVRHASFLGLRADKDAADVTGDAPPAVVISSRDRIVFPDAKATKGDLADYYEAVAPLFLPHAERRPVSLVRCPQGRAKKCFFQKHAHGGLGDALMAIPITEKDGGKEDYIGLADARGLLQCVQMGTIEFHGWASRAPHVENPDRMIFDLDPDEGLGFAEVKQAAADIADQLRQIGLTSFPLLSGGKGVHVVVPLAPGHSWDAHKDFAKRFAEALSMDQPDRFVATMSKAKRKGKIFIDWLRNQRGATAILPYSARARSGAPVAAPVSWTELEKLGTAAAFTIRDAKKLHTRANSAALSGWGEADQKLPDI